MLLQIRREDRRDSRCVEGRGSASHILILLILRPERHLAKAFFRRWRALLLRRQPWGIAGTLTVYAGLWDEWKSRETGEVFRSRTVITCPPNELIDSLHDRMPVILAEDDWPAWLGEDYATPGELVQGARRATGHRYEPLIEYKPLARISGLSMGRSSI